MISSEPIENIKPCPFCGCELHQRFMQASEAWNLKIQCDCGACVGYESFHSEGYRQRLLDKWNARWEKGKDV